MKWVIEAKHDGMILREYLRDVIQLSGRLIKRAKNGKMMINDKEVTVRYLVKTGDELTIQLAEKRSESMVAEPVPFDLIYEDSHILVVHKEAGIPTIPSKKQPSYTLANGLLYYYEEKEIDATVHIVTRIDTDTSGLVLVAKNPHSHSLLSSMQREHTIKRQYAAIIHGIMEKKSGTINLAIDRKPGSIIERRVSEKGQKAITHYEVISEGQTNSLLHVQLETGRTHQIRVHFSALGHPLLGDDLYGGKRHKINRQALHCAEISFIHPFSKKTCHFTSELPADMKALIE